MAENKLLSPEIVKQVGDLFSNVKEPVQVLYFGKQQDCDYCEDTLQLLTEVTSISPKLGLSAYDLNEHADLAAQYGVDKAPGFVLVGKDGDRIIDYGVRYSGIPAGHEFSSLVQDIVQVSERDSGLDKKTREFLSTLEQPVHLMVFVTPTWPYCPRAVVLAHQMAIESPLVQAEAVEASEFPELADQFKVSGVPQTTINLGAGTVVGAVPEENMINEIRRVLKNG